jgi:anti-sigma B factor antagonist
MTTTDAVPKADQPAVATVVAIAGQLIVGNRQEFKQRVIDHIAEGNATIDVDLTDCGYIDSSGLGALFSCAKKCREAGGELTLFGLNEDLRTLLELQRLDTLFCIRP